MAAEINISSKEELSSELREVVEGLDDALPSGSSAIVQIAQKGRFYSRHVSETLKESPEACDLFPRRTSRKKPTFTSPNTWLVGAFDKDSLLAWKWGLFLRLNGAYYDREVQLVLGAKRVGHTTLDLNQLTGRIPGTVSPILERHYLEACAIVHFDRSLVDNLSHPDAIVNFPLTNAGHFYVARGMEFLTGYAQLMKKFGIPTNLS